MASALLGGCSAPRPELAPQSTPQAPRPGAGGTALVASGDSGYSLVVDRSHAYWLDRQSLLRVSKDNGVQERVQAVGDALVGLTQDAEHVYFVAGSGAAGALISLSKRDLSSIPLSRTRVKIRRLANDDTHVYWTAYGDTVGRVSKADGKLEIVARGQHDPESIHVDEDSLYWTNTGPRGADNLMDLMVQRKTNGSARRLFDDCFALVGDRDAVYCAGRDAIWRVSKADGRTTRLTPALQDRPYALALTPHRVYWSTLGSGGARRIDGRLVGSDRGTLMSVAKTGGLPVAVARDLTEPYVLATDAHSLWWRDARGLHRMPLAMSEASDAGPDYHST